MNKNILHINIEDFLRGIKYKPIHVSYDTYDSVYMVEFRSKNKKEPTLEFYNHLNSDGCQHIYFEIIDFDGYEDGTIIDKNRRICVLNTTISSISESEEIQKTINNMLFNLYK